jgi:hypothetical protein
VVKVALADRAALVVLVLNEAEAKLVAAVKVADKVDLEDQAAVKAVLAVLVAPADRAGLTLRMTQRSKKS